MQIWVDIEDSAGNRQGDGPIALLSASINRPLDGIGSVSFTYPARDDRANTLVIGQRRARVWVDYLGTIREVGFGIITDIVLNEGDGERIISVTGPDIMQELHNANTLQNRQFENTAVTTVSTDLVGLATGWSDTVDGGLGNINFRADVHSVMKSYQALADHNSIHFRLGTGKEVQLGAFGDDSGFRAWGPIIDYVGVEADDNLLLIESLTLKSKSQDIANWIIPLGGGEGHAQLTIEHSDRSVGGGDPYDIDNTPNPDGTTAYYIQDATSITTYGEIRKPVLFKDIAPLSHGLNARKHAANALYDAAVAWLIRNKDEIVSYNITCRKPKNTIRPGDKLTVRYKGDVVDGDGVLVTYIDVNDDFWVMDVTESFGDSGPSLSMTINNIDRHLLDEADIVVGAIEQVMVQSVAVQTGVTVFENTFYDFVSKRTPGASDPDRSATFYYKPQTFITDIIGVWFDFKTDYLITTAAPTFASSLYTYAVHVDDQYPSDVQLWINGVDQSSSYGGPWNTSGVNLQLDISDLDITADLESESGEIFQKHIVEIRCGQPGVLRGIEVPGFAVVTADTTHGVVAGTFRTMAIVSALAPI